jgi:hypothetical protein
VGIALLMMVVLSLMSIYLNVAIEELGYWSATFWTRILTMLFLLPIIPLFYKDFRKTSIRKYTGLAAMSVFSAVGTLAYLGAVAGNVSITTAITSLPMSMIMTFILSRFKPDLLENHSLKVYAIRFTAVTIMILAALKL